MNMRWGWTLAVFAALGVALTTAPAWSQGGANYPGGANNPVAGPAAAPAMADPATLAAMQAQAYQVQAYQAQMYQAMAAQQAAMYGQAAMYAQPDMPPQGPGPSPDVYGSYGYMPAEYAAAAAYAQPGYAQAGYGQGGPGPYGAPGYDPSAGGGYDQGGPGPGGPGGDACPYCNGQGCERCNGTWGLPGTDGNGQWLPNGLLGDVLGLVAPYPDGGCAAPRWYDFAFDFMMLKRDNTGRSQDFTSNGIGGPIVLDTNNLNFGQFRPGFRFSAAMQLMAANSLEFTYFGQFNFTSQAAVTSPTGNLYSVFSNFGQSPLGAFAEYENANYQQISYQSAINSFEINWRNRWMAPNCRYQGSWTLGVRHFILDEKLRFSSSSTANGYLPAVGAFIPARGQDDTDTTNDLTGIQLGTDAWICILPGLRFGGEFQAGVYGNHMNINTTVGSNLNTNVFREQLQSNNVSFIGQSNLLATYRFNYQWSGRIGYQFLYLNGVALASENFNPLPPLVNAPRATRVVNDGSAFYHGWNVGLEYMW